MKRFISSFAAASILVCGSAALADEIAVVGGADGPTEVYVTAEGGAEEIVIGGADESTQIYITAAEENPVTVKVNGETLALETPAFVVNDRTLVPMRAIFEAVGADVVWDGEVQTVHSSKVTGDRVRYLTLQVGQTKAFVDGEAVELDVPAVILNDRTFVPLRFVVESLDGLVEWDGANMTVDITVAAS